MKCELCKASIEEIFLGKIKGTIIKDEKGKHHMVCFDCQRKLNKQEMLAKL